VKPSLTDRTLRSRSVLRLIAVAAAFLVCSTVTAAPTNERPVLNRVDIAVSEGAMDLAVGYCDDSEGFIDWAAGAGVLRVRLVRVWSGVAQARWGLRDPIAFDGGCITWRLSAAVPLRMFGKGRVFVSVRVIDPEGRRSRQVVVRKRFSS
jgi:hypothetical protein